MKICIRRVLSSQGQQHFFVKNVELATTNLQQVGTPDVVQWGFKGTFLLIRQISKNKFVGCE